MEAEALARDFREDCPRADRALRVRDPALLLPPLLLELRDERLLEAALEVRDLLPFLLPDDLRDLDDPEREDDEREELLLALR